MNTTITFSENEVKKIIVDYVAKNLAVPGNLIVTFNVGQSYDHFDRPYAWGLKNVTVEVK